MKIRASWPRAEFGCILWRNWMPVRSCCCNVALRLFQRLKLTIKRQPMLRTTRLGIWPSVTMRGGVAPPKHRYRLMRPKNWIAASVPPLSCLSTVNWSSRFLRCQRRSPPQSMLTLALTLTLLLTRTRTRTPVHLHLHRRQGNTY